MKYQVTSVAVVVKDRKKALAWYTKKLGLKVLANNDHWVVVGDRRRGLALHLCQTRQYDPKGKLEPGNTGIAISVKGPMMKAYQELKRRGVKFPDPPEKVEWGWYCLFSDPDGNLFWLFPSR